MVWRCHLFFGGCDLEVSAVHKFRRWPGGWLISSFVGIFYSLDFYLFSLSLLLARFPHPALMPNYWVRCSV